MATKDTKFSDLLVAAMDADGQRISVRAFAKKSGCSASHVSDCRTGNSGPDPDEAARWADLLAIDDREAWMAAAAVARARSTSTGRPGSHIYEERISALELVVAQQREEILRRTAQLREMATIVRNSGRQLPDSVRDLIG